MLDFVKKTKDQREEQAVVGNGIIPDQLYMLRRNQFNEVNEAGR